MVSKKHIVLIIPRGEAVKNFLYSDTIKVLNVHARVSVLSVVKDQVFVAKFEKYTEKYIPIDEVKESTHVNRLRSIIYDAHMLWLNSKGGIYHHNMGALRAKARGRLLFFRIRTFILLLMANRPSLQLLTNIENRLTYKLRPDDTFLEIFKELKPDLVFNTSHIHGPVGEYASKMAMKLRIPTVGFLFSWDNLFSRSRINIKYDEYIVWTKKIKKDLMWIYPFINSDKIHITGTPQFDYHFRDEFIISREELAKQIGFDPHRPYILYTTGIATHVLEEYRHVQSIIDYLNEANLPQRPQLVVRTYVKGTSQEMYDIRDKNYPDVFFPKVEWDEVLYTSAYSDLSVYSSLLRNTALGINVASTVMIELFMFNKPAINIAYNPAGSNLSYPKRYSRFIEFEHFAPVAQSGGTVTVHSLEELKKSISEALQDPTKHQREQEAFLKEMFGDTLDGKSGERVAKVLLKLAGSEI